MAEPIVQEPLDWQSARRRAERCQACGLANSRTNVVFGEGNPSAQILFIGEGPGANEDRLGRPFVGRAGDLLNRILEATGFRREDVYITNIVLCRPPSNRTPTVAEMEACRPHWQAKIALIRPQIIVCLGSTAVRALIDPQARITQIRGVWHRFQGIPVMPTFHPAALLRDPSKKRPVWEDFKAIRRTWLAFNDRERLMVELADALGEQI